MNASQRAVRSLRSISLTAAALAAAAAVALPGSALAATKYDTGGLTPTYPWFLLKPVPRWTNAEVDKLVQTTLVSVDAMVPASQFGAPAACDKVSFLRIKLKAASDDAEQADAAILMVPGVLEGAGAFSYIGKQLVYMAHQAGKTIEVWGMDRRSNCLEDHAGFDAAEKVFTSGQAEDALVNYYYKGSAVNGKVFDGFLKPAQTTFLSEFGMAQTTQDMYTIIKSMMPTDGVSKRKAFIAGHSLGGAHVSTFLAWDFDGDASTTDDAGYNQVAGAIGLETTLAPIPDVPKVIYAIAPSIAKMVGTAYASGLENLRSGKASGQMFIPGLIGPEVLALPTALGVIASKGANTESNAIKKIGTLSPELDGFTKLLIKRDPLADWKTAPNFADFRFTTSALIGMAFSKDFTPLSFLHTGLGFMNGGTLAQKDKYLVNAGTLPLVGPFIASLVGNNTLWTPTNAGPSLTALGTGPLYGWAVRDQIGTRSNMVLFDTRYTTKFTNLESNPATMSDFIAALHMPLDFTEWYFPLRIMLDTIEMANPADAIKNGLNVYYPQGVTQVPNMTINGDQGLMTSKSLGSVLPQQPNQRIAKGFGHLDPLFETVSSPSQVDYVMQPILDFINANAH
jgi:hypothetical protein